MGAKEEKGLTQKQEKFCLVYIETGNATEAYRQAYDTANMKPATINREAKALLDDHKISTRITQLRAPAIKRAQITLEAHLADLQALRDAAAGEGQYSAAITAEVSRGKVSGLYTDKIDLTADLSMKVEVVFGDDD